MGCENCANNISGGTPKGCGNNGTCGTGGCNKLNSYDWLSNIYYLEESRLPDILEIKFKGTRKGFYRNKRELDLEIGDYVAVETPSGGYDLGMISLKSELVRHQMKKYGVEEDNDQMLSIFRKATEQDMEKFCRKNNELEEETKLRARKIARGLGLQMKISDVEYQGDLTKATFYYTAEGRVDFRELIKQLATTFRIKVEMKQIGLRQEAGRLGGIGSCGRELCCSTWLTDFDSVPTVAARYQNLFINPLKLAGQCGRLKCCLNYELDTYLEALETFPDENTVLLSEKGNVEIAKTDILKGLVWLKYKGKRDMDSESAHLMVPFKLDKVNEYIQKNQKNEKMPPLEDFSEATTAASTEALAFKDVIGEESLTRFDHKDKPKGRRKGRGRSGSKPQGSRNNKRRKPDGNQTDNKKK